MMKGIVGNFITLYLVLVCSLQSQATQTWPPPSNATAPHSVRINGSMYVEQGQELNLTCTAEGGPDNIYEWILNGARLEGSEAVSIISTANSSILSIGSVDAASHKGTYMCNVTNPEGFDQDTQVVTVSPNDIVSTEPMMLIASKGDNITLTCQTEAGPNNTYVWMYKASNLVCTQSNCSDGIFTFNTTDEEILNATKSFSPILNLYNVNAPENGGEYVCVVVNDAGIGLSSSHLNFIPEFFKQPQKVITELSANESMICEAEAFPYPTYQWQKAIPNGFAFLSDEQNSIISFQSVSYNNSGTYHCIAKNEINNTIYLVESENATVVVSPSGSISIQGTPEEKVNQERLLVDHGDDFNITCSSQGGPDNIYMWKLNNISIEDGNLFSISTASNDGSGMSVLQVVNLDAATHKGIYQCEVQNEAGMDSTMFEVIVSPNGIVTTTPEIVSASRNDNITFECETEAMSMNATYLWFVNASQLVCTQSNCSDGFFTFNATDEDIINATVGGAKILQLNEVNHSNGGEYTCLIFNDAGIGLSSSQLYILPAFTVQPEDKEVNFTDQAILLCNAESFPYFTIQWQKLDNEIFEDIPGENKSMLVFENAFLSDSNVYRCAVSNVINGTTHTIQSRNATLKVNPISPYGSVLLSGPMFLNDGQQVKYNCTAEGGPNNTYIWMKNRVVIDDDDHHDIETIVLDTFSSSVLTVISVDAARDQGTYNCSVSNVVGTGEDSLNVTVSPEGIVATQPVSINASRGYDVTFTCETEAGPDTIYLWLYNASNLVCTQSNCSDGIYTFNATDEDVLNATLSTSSVLTLANVNAPDNGGEYTCVAINDAGVGLSTSTLYFEPQFIEEPVDTEANSIFDSVSLRCRAEAFPFPNYQWQKRVSGVFEEIVGETNEVLVEDDAEHSDAGVYRCVVTNTINNTINTIISREATIYVTPNNSVNFSVSSSGVFDGRNLYIEKGGEFNITCMAAGGPENSHFWRLNGEMITNNVSFTISSSVHDSMSVSILSVSSVDANTHKGNYVCEVINEAGDHASGLTVHVSPNEIVSVDPSIIIANYNDNAMFTCLTDAGPSNMYEWLVNATDLICTQLNCSDGITSFNVTDEELLKTAIGSQNTLLLQSVNASHGGKYSCIVFNDAGIGLSFAYLYIQPYFITEPQDIEIDFAESFTLECEAESIPDSTIQWQKELSNGDFYDISNEESSTLVFEKALLSDSGIYRCVATNIINGTEYMSNSTNAVVQVNAISPNGTVSLTGPYFVSQDEQVKYNCTAEGGPNNTYIWMKNGIIINDDNQHDIETIVLDTFSSSVLTVISVDATRDQGTYRCNVSNVGGTGEDSLNVTVSPEGIVTTKPVSINASRGYDVTFTCETEAGPDTIYLWFYNASNLVCTQSNCSDGIYTFNVTDEDALNATLSMSSVLTLTNVNAPDNGGEYTCVAINDAGVGLSISTLYFEPQFIEEPVDTETNSSLSLICRAESFPFPMYQWQKKMSGMFSDIAEENSELFKIDADSDAGVYQCIVMNTINNTVNSITSREAIIYVSGLVVSPSAFVIESTWAILRWTPPVGTSEYINSYEVAVEAVRFDENPLDSSREKRQTNEDVLACFHHMDKDPSMRLIVSGTEVNISLIPFTQFRVSLSVNAIGSGNFSEYFTFSTKAADPGVVVNLTGIARDATNVLLSWRAPLCPNGPIIGYYVYYRRTNYTQQKPIDSARYSALMIFSRNTSISTVIGGLSVAETYAFHVRAVFYNSSVSGLVDKEILVTLSSQIILEEADLQLVVSKIKTGSRGLTIGLPSLQALESVGITNIVYYGVVVVPNPVNDFMFIGSDFDETYPDLQPYENRGNNKYYIAAGWNNLSLVPEEFRAGDKSRTTAIRNGIEEDYLNAELKPLTTYCFYVLLHQMTDIESGVVTRYTELACRETERGYNLAAVVAGVLLVFLLLLLCAILLCVFCCCYYRKKRQYKFGLKETDVYEEPHYMICNPAFRTDKEKQTMRVSEFPSYVNYMHSRKDFNFTEEFAAIEPQHTPQTTVSNANRTKNRYNSVLAYDHSRVILKETFNGSDYINANYIEGFGRPGEFIATQAPLVTTVEHFWSMIWEQEVTSIVMLTNLEENEKTKCYKYWPGTKNEKENYGSVEVELNHEETVGGIYTIRSLSIIKNGQKPKEVKQFHFTAWCDNWSSTCHSQFLDFIQTVREHCTFSKGPMVVHCSTGADRTGVFIAIVAQMDRCEREQTIDIYNYVQYMRKQRPCMVLNEVEYIFVHDTLVEATKRGVIKDTAVNGSTDQPTNGYEK